MTTGIVTPTLTEKDVVGKTPEGSKAYAEAVAGYDRAKEALKLADAAELFKLYEAHVKKLAQMEDLFFGVCEHYTGSKDKPHFAVQPSESAVAAMERVALAAIDLAKLAFERRPAP
jgi:hypothetical protein